MPPPSRNGADKEHGLQVGAVVAAKVLALRANDGSGVASPPFTPGDQPGDYRSTPPNFPSPLFTTWGNVKPFVLNAGSQFRPEPPPALTSAAYATALNEGQGPGSEQQHDADSRPDHRRQILGASHLEHLERNCRESRRRPPHEPGANARLFALLNLSFADSAIAMYDGKYHYQLWRPVTAIRLAGTDGNPATAGDPNWTPLTATAADPSYPR